MVGVIPRPVAIMARDSVPSGKFTVTFFSLSAIGLVWHDHIMMAMDMVSTDRGMVGAGAL